MLRKKYTMLGLVIFAVIILVLSGCGGGGGGSNGGGGGGGGLTNFDGFLGTWVSQGLTPQVKLIVSTKIGAVQKDEFLGGYYQYFTGSVQCDGLIGTVNITEDDSNLFGNYIVANFFSVEGVEGSYLVVSVSTEDKSIDFSGSLTAADTMMVGFSEDNLGDFGLAADDPCTFKKQ
ncbi:MAG TPA: hypothetical protein DDZ55_10880 [Firmicutes bacterium]|nr:hypothetical protein [Bacillota bacterium]